MGCDIHTFVEVRNKQTNRWELVDGDFSLDEFEREFTKKEKGCCPFYWRSYSMFAFLAGVRNYDHCEPLSKPRGLPCDVSTELEEEYNITWGCHSASYLTSKELLSFNYDKTFWNRRVTKQTSKNSWNGASIAEEGEGKIVSYRENLGELFFTHLKELKELGDTEDVRIVFWFDN